MKKENLEKRLNKILKEEETFLLTLLLLARLTKDDKYSNLSELIFMFDNYNEFKQFIKYYEGQVINVPTYRELQIALNLLSLFQKVYIDKKPFKDAYDETKLGRYEVSESFSQKEIEMFFDYVKDNNKEILGKFKKL